MMLRGHSMSDLAGRLIAVDPQICEIVQRTERELVGMTYQELTHPDDRANNEALIASLAARNGPVNIRKRYVRPDGSFVWASAQVSRLGTHSAGRLVGTITLAGSDGSLTDPEARWLSARRFLAYMAQRQAELGHDLSDDKLHALLLHIYLAEAEGRLVSVNELGTRTNMSVAMVGRWIKVLEWRGFVEPADVGNGLLQFTAEGVAKIERVLDFLPDV